MTNDITPQLPGIVNGVAYEDSMGGLSVDLCLDDDGDTDVQALLDRHMDSEHVYVVSASHCSVDMLMAAPYMYEALQKCLDALHNETLGKTDSYWIKTVKAMAANALARAIGQ